MSTTIKHILVTFLLFFACFGGQDTAAMPVAATTVGGVQQEEGIAQGELYTWPGALPELVRLFSAQATPATPYKEKSSPVFGTTATEWEHWLQQGIDRYVVSGKLTLASLSGTRIIFPFHYFW